MFKLITPPAYTHDTDVAHVRACMNVSSHSKILALCIYNITIHIVHPEMTNADIRANRYRMKLAFNTHAALLIATCLA